MKEVHLQIETADGSLERVAELTIWLKDQIKQLPIESIEIPKASVLPEGARGDPFTWGALTLKLAPIVLNQLLNLLRDRINRQNIPAKVVVECDGKRVSLEGTPDPQQLEATEKFLKDINTVISERRAALLIACDGFDDPKYKPLSVSVSDARRLAKLLSDPEIGQFSVDLLVNEKRDVISEQLEHFFVKARRDDVLLLYFAGHGDLDDLGNLYLIAKNTKGDLLRSSGIGAEFIRQTMAKSSSRSQILILDCCYSGAFPNNWVPRADASIGIRQKLSGEGRIVLTASDAIEFAYEKREPSGAVKSLFTSRIIEGIDGGKADLDGDGFISIDELYNYVDDRIRDEDPSQRPLKLGVVHGQLWLGRAVPRKDAIPRDVIELLNHILGDARIAGIGQLQKLASANEALYPAAVQVLTKMLSDRDSAVQHVARDVLDKLEAKRREPEEKEQIDAKRRAEEEKKPLGAQRRASEEKQLLEIERQREKMQRLKSTRRRVENKRLDAEPRFEVATTPKADHLTPHRVHTLKGHTNWVKSVAFSPDGALLATGSLDKTIRLWCVADGTPVRMLKGHTNWVNSVAFSPDGALLATGSNDKTVRLWRVATGEVRTLEGHTDLVKCVTFSPDGALLATGSRDKTIRLWCVADGTPVRMLKGHTNWVNSVAFSLDGALLATGSNDKTVRLWCVADGTPVRTLKRHTNWVNSVAFSPDGVLLATGSNDKTVCLWRVATGEVRTLEGHTDLVNSAAFSPDGTLLATGSNDKTVRLWRVADGTPVCTLKGHTVLAPWIKSVAFSPDGALLASGSGDKTVRLWSLK